MLWIICEIWNISALGLQKLDCKNESHCRLLSHEGLRSAKWCFLLIIWWQLGYHLFWLEQFSPLWNIVYNYQNELVAIRHRKGSHEIDAPQIKNFHLKDRCKRHHVFMCDPTRHLTSGTELVESISVLKESGPIEPTLKDFLSSLSPPQTSLWQNVNTLWCSSSEKYLLIIWSGQYLNKYGSSQKKNRTCFIKRYLSWPDQFEGVCPVAR